jgi:predicted NUDIX family NTP pyrophosphohydrolase
MQQFPEIDRAAFLGIEQAKQKVNPAQMALIDELQERVGIKDA